MSAENDSTKGPLTQLRSAKNYMDSNKIPQMFQSLMASLMVERPENHFDFLDSKLEEIKEIGLANVDWETFVYELHPTRDAVRQEMIQDGNVYNKKATSGVSGSTATGKRDSGTNESNDDDYEPQLFNLTETQD